MSGVKRKVDELDNVENLISQKKQHLVKPCFPVTIDSLLFERYIVKRKLGSGAYSTVWLALDITPHAVHQMVAIKVPKTSSSFEEQDEEMKICLKIQEKDTFKYCSELLSSFSIFDKDGRRYLCLVLELLEGSLWDLLKDFKTVYGPRVRRPRGLDMKDVKRVMKHILTSLQFLHEDCKLIHADLKPANILIRGPHHLDLKKEQTQDTHHYESKNIKVLPLMTEKWRSYSESGYEPQCVLGDFGLSIPISGHDGHIISTICYRAPEVCCRCKDYDEKADIFSAGCIAFELLTGDILFPEDYIYEEQGHLCMVFELLGMENIPERVVKQGRKSTCFFTSDGKLKSAPRDFWPLQSVLQEKYCISTEDADPFCSFVLSMLHVDSTKRVSAREALKHPWLN